MIRIAILGNDHEFFRDWPEGLGFVMRTATGAHDVVLREGAEPAPALLAQLLASVAADDDDDEGTEECPRASLFRDAKGGISLSLPAALEPQLATMLGAADLMCRSQERVLLENKAIPQVLIDLTRLGYRMAREESGLQVTASNSLVGNLMVVLRSRPDHWLECEDTFLESLRTILREAG